MNSELAGTLAYLMDQFWQFFNANCLPGTNVTFGMLLFFPIFVRLVMKIVHSILTVSPYQAGSKGDNISKNGE